MKLKIVLFIITISLFFLLLGFSRRVNSDSNYVLIQTNQYLINNNSTNIAKQSGLTPYIAFTTIENNISTIIPTNTFNISPTNTLYFNTPTIEYFPTEQYYITPTHLFESYYICVNIAALKIRYCPSTNNTNCPRIDTVYKGDIIEVYESEEPVRNNDDIYTWYERSEQGGGGFFAGSYYDNRFVIFLGQNNNYNPCNDD